MSALETPYSLAYQLAYLLVGEAEATAQALLETLRLHARSDGPPWYALAQTVLRNAADLSPDRFFLRTLANPQGASVQVDRLPVSERTALLLDAAGLFTLDEIASLLRMPTASLQEVLNRTWRQVGAERGHLWAALLTTVPPMEERLQRQVEATLAGEGIAQDGPADGAPAISGRGRPRRLPVIGLLFAGALLLLFAIRWWPKQPEAIPTDALLVTEVPPIAVDQKAPPPATDRIDLSTYRPEAVKSLTAEGFTVPHGDGERAIAQRLFQWLGEAEFVGEAPEITIGAEWNYVSLGFTDGRYLWLQPERECFKDASQCTVAVGGEGQVPIRLRQSDLSRYLVAGGWRLDHTPNIPFLVFPGEGEHRRTEAEIRDLMKPEERPDLQVVNVVRMMMLRVRQEDGGWRTFGEPIWQALLRPTEAGKTQGVLLIYSDETGALVRRVEVNFGPRPGS